MLTAEICSSSRKPFLPANFVRKSNIFVTLKIIADDKTIIVTIASLGQSLGITLAQIRFKVHAVVYSL